MTYSAEISRRKPGLFLFLLDQSRSMSHKLAGQQTSKAREATDAINRQIYEIIYRCTKTEGVRDYFEIGIIGYGSKTDTAESLLPNATIVPISRMAENPIRIEKTTKRITDSEGEEVETEMEFPVWFEPVANFNTPMVKAFKLAKEWCTEWLHEHSDSYPPVVINISDGAATDGDPIPAAEELKSMSTSDGNLLLWNCHLSESKQDDSVIFPSDEDQLPKTDKFSRELFRMSSCLPEPFQDVAAERGLEIKNGARGYVFNAGLDELLELLDIGTRAPTENLH